MVTMNDIVAFVEKAMRNNLNIEAYETQYNDGSQDNDIVIHLENDYFRFNLYTYGKTQYLTIYKDLNSFKIPNISELDIANFRLLVLKAKEYSENKVLESFNNFFSNEEKNIINDLDDEND